MKKSRTSIIHRQQTKNAVLSLCAVFYWRVQSAVNLNNKMTILLKNEKRILRTTSFFKTHFI